MLDSLNECWVFYTDPEFPTTIGHPPLVALSKTSVQSEDLAAYLVSEQVALCYAYLIKSSFLLGDYLGRLLSAIVSVKDKL